MAQVFPAHQCIVVGGGLAGFSAAHTVLEHGGRCVCLDKSPFCGGNSTKATSGINGAGTSTQKAKGIKDSGETFLADTLKGGAKKPEIAKVMCYESGPGVEWLIEKFDLDLSLVARLGGHSQQRTHRGAERFPGMTITYALMQRFEKIAETSDRARIVNKARVFNLLCNGKTVIGCEYEKAGMSYKEYGPVIMCSGGFGADFSSNGYLAQYRPDLLHLPTTNGEHCTGDGIKMGERVGAKTIDLEWVQVHPTGLVKPDDADAKVKFLAAEALRGVGGVLIDREGKRFANELGRRDYVTGRMWKNKPPFRLCLNSKASKEIHWHVEHYKGRGVMKYYASGRDLAKEMGIPEKVIEDTFNDHTSLGQKQESDPDGGKYDAYPTGKSHDVWGKKFFHNLPTVIDDEYNVAIVTPSIHYCMGGLEITMKGEVLGPGDQPIQGFYAAGEIAGGVHGNNRLGGSSLLDCVAYGRVAGRSCASWMFGKDGKYRLFPTYNLDEHLQGGGY
jgi:flavocytochrome c